MHSPPNSVALLLCRPIPVRPHCYHDISWTAGTVFDETDKAYSITPTDSLIRFWRSKVTVKVTPWFKYVVAMASTSTLGCRSLSCS